jgi:hypothetical protein
MKIKIIDLPGTVGDQSIAKPNQINIFLHENRKYSSSPSVICPLNVNNGFGDS